MTKNVLLIKSIPARQCANQCSLRVCLKGRENCRQKNDNACEWRKESEMTARNVAGVYYALLTAQISELEMANVHF